MDQPDEMKHQHYETLRTTNMRRMLLRLQISVVLLLSMLPTVHAEELPRDFFWAKEYRSDELVLTSWDSFGWSLYGEKGRGDILSKALMKTLSQGLPYPTISVHFPRGITYSYVGGYPFRRKWHLDAEDSNSWLLGQLKHVCEVEQFSDFEFRVLEPVCQFNKQFRF